MTVQGTRHQRAAFLAGEGDAWWRRNRERVPTMADPVVAAVAVLGRRFKATLEIGCGDGRRLAALAQLACGECHGVDPSNAAVRAGMAAAPTFRPLHLVRGTADRLPYPDRRFDLVIFGFCLYLIDREDLFRVAAEADRVLAEGGCLAIYDFHGQPRRNPYRWRDGVESYHMDYPAMFLWNPAYRVVSQVARSCSDPTALAMRPSETAAITILIKSPAEAYPLPHLEPSPVAQVAAEARGPNSGRDSLEAEWIGHIEHPSRTPPTKYSNH